MVLSAFTEIVPQHPLLMFLIMAVDTEIFPVGAVRRIVVMIAVFVVNGEEVSVRIIKFTGALGAYETVDAERLLSVRAWWETTLQFLYNIFDGFTTFLSFGFGGTAHGKCFFSHGLPQYISFLVSIAQGTISLNKFGYIGTSLACARRGISRLITLPFGLRGLRSPN